MIPPCPPFMRESMWRLLGESERQGILDLVEVSEGHGARLAAALEDVERHRRLARGFADQAKTLLESIRSNQVDSHGSPPSVVRRVAKLVDDLQATARFADVRGAAPVSEGEMAYSPPLTTPSNPPPGVLVELDELRVPTKVGAAAAARGRSESDPDRDLRPPSYHGDLEEIEVEELDEN